MIDSGMEMDGKWEWKEGIPGPASEKELAGHALWIIFSFVQQRLNMFLITQHLVIRIEVIFVLHFSSFSFLSLVNPVNPGLAKHPRFGRRFGGSVYAAFG
jgi:hypothetical protein